MSSSRSEEDFCIAVMLFTSSMICFAVGMFAYSLGASDARSQCCCHHLPPSASVLVQEPTR